MDCKSNIVSIANKEQEKWVFPIGEEKQKNKKQKKNKKKKKQTTNIWVEKELFTLYSKTHWQTRWKWDSNLDLGVMGWWRQKLDLGLDLGMLTVEMRFNECEAQPWMFWGVDGGEECRGLVFCWGNKRDIGSGKRWATKGYRQGVLSPNLKIVISYICLAFFTKINTHTKHIFFFVFWTLKHFI